jgi:hypothetical protein
METWLTGRVGFTLPRLFNRTALIMNIEYPSDLWCASLRTAHWTLGSSFILPKRVSHIPPRLNTDSCSPHCTVERSLTGRTFLPWLDLGLTRFGGAGGVEGQLALRIWRHGRGLEPSWSPPASPPVPARSSPPPRPEIAGIVLPCWPPTGCEAPPCPLYRRSRGTSRHSGRAWRASMHRRRLMMVPRRLSSANCPG